ncbi:MAG: cbb3-type cytochrome c oxidase subunit I [Puniceicoccaceae bacterium]
MSENLSSTANAPAISTHQPPPPTAEISAIGLRRPDHTTGWTSWLTTVDHKRIGLMYGIFALAFFVIGGLEALVIRLQLAVAQNNLISPETYNQLFTMHGTTMVFLAVMPLSAAFFNYLVPLQIGARDVAFPRLNSFSLWTFVAGAIIINLSWFLQAANAMGWLSGPLNQLGIEQTDFVPAAGWFGYAPLTGSEFSGVGTDFWIFGLQVLGIGSIAASLNFIVTIMTMRAPGMKMMRLPVFTWMTLITSFLIIFAFPPVTVALGQVMFDRFFGTNFYVVAQGGQPILWQHLFWIFGHPEVYILILPAMGIISEILPTFSRKPLYGYPLVIFSGAIIGFLGFAVWSHHMFTTGLGPIGTAAFSLLTMAIAVPTGVKIFNWIGTLWGGQIRFEIPMIFALGFIWMFMIGGFSGIMHSSAPADAQQQDSYFVVAHFHYVLIGGSILALLAGVYYWLPKATGKMWDQKLGQYVAWLVILGLNVTFFPMHFLGLAGMPRRTHSYLEGTGFSTLNLVCTIGAFILAFGILLFLIDIWRTVRKGKPAPADPWDARTLEWSLPSPPPVYNFASTPIIPARDAFYSHKLSLKGDPAYQPITSLPSDGHGIHMPSQSWMPLFASFGFLVLGFAMALKSTGIPFMGYLAIAGLGITTLGIYLWALEGAGGYHLHPENSQPGSSNPK